jgi:hypothetical protein
MSEPSQLYVRVHISREGLDAFLASPFPDPSADEALLAWLGTAEYYGERYTPELIRERVDSDGTIAEWVEAVTEPATHGIVMPHSNVYDGTTQMWTLAVLDFSENYDDYIAAVAAFRVAAKYKDLPGDDGFLIYGYLFEEGAVAAAVRIQGDGEVRFIDEGEAASLVAEADAAMETLVAEGEAGAEEL